ncbi:unnamed protein product [Rhizophagus irregularis]|nr:unnamed protein product [Rhizophagus irregularis]
MFSQNILLTGHNIRKYIETNLTNWTSGNKKIDDFIQERQLKINQNEGIVLEWIPYNQFNEIKETGKNGDSYKTVALKCLHKSQESIDSLINEANKYSTNYEAFQALYGISQNPDTGDYVFVQSYTINLANWISGNEKIDDFIQEMQLKINDYNDIVLEWIPYNQFNEIKETGKNSLMTVYSAIWKDGPLYKKSCQDKNYTRDSNKEVDLKYLHNTQESIDSLVNEAKKYLIKDEAFQVLYGITQNPDTGDYILVLNWTSGNEKIDNFIQERQESKIFIIKYCDIVLEWIPYNQFNEIKETGKNGQITVYSAIWKDGPLCKYWKDKNYTRDSNKKVALKCLYNLQESIDSLINEAKKHSTEHEVFQELYGISQNSDTGDYVFVQSYTINLANWISGNEKIDDFIQEMQLKINDYNDIVLEWIPYNQFNEIKETGKNSLMTVYSAIWKDGPLYKKSCQDKNYTRDSNKEVALICLYNLQESIDSLLNEAKKYSIKYDAFQVLYGISQNQDTGDYIFVQSYTINLVNWISGNEKIDNFIQEMQLKINDYNDIVLEWIPYNQFNEIKETGKNSLMTVYSAIWKDGPLHYKYQEFEYKRDSYKKVDLKCLYNTQESINSLVNEAKKYSIKHEVFQVLYGITQNPDTGDYILVLNWTSGNEKIDNFIQERQERKINIIKYNDIMLEWIPYNQFNEIKETGKNGQITIYSAIWKDGPLCNKSWQYKNYTRDSNKKVALKCLYNLQKSIDFLINEVCNFSKYLNI